MSTLLTARLRAASSLAVRLSRSSRVVAVCAAFALFAGQIATSAHDETEHVVCPEHGEELHAESAEAKALPVLGYSSGTEPESHAFHCSGELFAPVEEADATLAWSAVSASFGAPTIPVGSARLAIALLRLAPKASPPVA